MAFGMHDIEKVRYKVKPSMTKAEAEIELIRALLGLGPLHDTVAAVRVLFEDGRNQFEAVRDGKP